jgi:hypothetical protein
LKHHPYGDQPAIGALVGAHGQLAMFLPLGNCYEVRFQPPLTPDLALAIGGSNSNGVFVAGSNAGPNCGGHSSYTKGQSLAVCHATPDVGIRVIRAAFRSSFQTSSLPVDWSQICNLEIWNSKGKYRLQEAYETELNAAMVQYLAECSVHLKDMERFMQVFQAKLKRQMPTNPNQLLLVGMDSQGQPHGPMRDAVQATGVRLRPHHGQLDLLFKVSYSKIARVDGNDLTSELWSQDFTVSL